MRRSRGERRRPADSYVHASGRVDLIGDQAVTEDWPTIGRRTEAVTRPAAEPDACYNGRGPLDFGMRKQEVIRFVDSPTYHGLMLAAVRTP